MRQSRAAGFTLIEVMLSVAILAAMVSLLWGSFSLGMRGQKRAKEISGRYHQLRLSTQRMMREISQAYLSKNDMLGATVPRTLFDGRSSGQMADLTFSSLSHMQLVEDAKESDQSLIRYFVAPDPKNPREMNLMRRETKRLGSTRPGEEGTAQVLLEGVLEVKFEFFDDVMNEWKERWNTRSADGQPDRLPSKVRLVLKIRDENDKPLTISTATRLFVRDPLWLSPQ